MYGNIINTAAPGSVVTARTLVGESPNSAFSSVRIEAPRDGINTPVPDEIVELRAWHEWH